MEIVEDIVVVGAGLAGLSTALGLHRVGIKSLVLEASDELRVTGFALVNWTNAWKALDVLGVGDSLRQQHVLIKGVVLCSTVSGSRISEISSETKGKHGRHEVRCVIRRRLVETMAAELPPDTIRFSSKVVSIEEENNFKVVHLADGSIIKTKVLIGCDGVNSIVAKYLGIERPRFSGRWSTRGIVEFPDGHNFEPKSRQFFGNGYRSGFFPCDENTLYWFFTHSSSTQDNDKEQDPAEVKQFVLKNLGKVPEEIRRVVEETNLENIISSPLKFRWPFKLFWPRAICKDNVCVAGDALHPMTPDIGQGGCSALEDGVVLARCLSKVILGIPEDEKEYERIKRGLKKFAEQRRWRSFELISTGYLIGMMQQSSGMVISFIRDNLLYWYLPGLPLKRADFDCGSLVTA